MRHGAAIVKIIGRMLLAGDIGGTKTLLGLFDRAPERPASLETGEFTTLDYSGLVPMIREFLKANNVDAKRIEAASFGVAGAVTGQVARMTNVPWCVDGAEIADGAGLRHVHVLNDLEAMATSVPVLEGDELAVLQQGVAQPNGNAAVIAAGTGLGEALLLNVDGRFTPGASEGGHADWGARTLREIEMLKVLTREYGRVSVEHILSGPGLVNVYQFTHDSFGGTDVISPAARTPRRLCVGIRNIDDPADLPKAISQSAMEKRCPMCVEALDMFVEAYGAEAGNLALRAVATAGIYVGGGIAPKILDKLRDGTFMRAFVDKGRYRDLLLAMPVYVVLNSKAALGGAGYYAAFVAHE